MTVVPSPGGSTYKLCPRCHSIYPASTKLCARDNFELIDDERILAGKFILVRKIGEGNMGAVYEAEQPQIGRTVAVKILRPDPEIMLRFEREVQAAGSINHANVVTIYESGLTDDGRGYIAMEYLDGESLAQHLDKHIVLSPARALELWIPAVRAMSAAHSRGIVHRDLKPDNIFLNRRRSDEGEETVVKVLDFGIAKLQRQGPHAKGTTPGFVIGTMQYMAPEQLQGFEATPRIDVYALALILVEMMTARLPWGSSKEQAYIEFAVRLVRPPTPLRELRPEQEFSPQLQQLVQDMLAMEPADRPAHAGEVVQRLKQVPEAMGLGRGDGSIERTFPGASSDRIRLPELPPTTLQRSGTAVVSRAHTFATAELRATLQKRAPIIGAALAALILAGGLYLSTRKPTAISDPTVDFDMAAPRLTTGDEDSARPSATTDAGAVVQPQKPVPHRPVHESAPLQVQFAFTDARGVQLTCAGKRQPPPDCSADGVCKSLATVPAGQKCIAEKDKVRKTYTYKELQKTPPDRKNLIHVLLRFP